MNFSQFRMVSYSDGLVTIALEPPTAIGGWTIEFKVTKFFGGSSGLITKSCSSGYGGGQSGITVTNSGQGILQVRINAADMSGQDAGAYPFQCKRTDSGFATPTSQGYYLRLPGGV